MDFDSINENIVFGIDEDKYLKIRKVIRRTCMLSGFAPPQYLDMLDLEIPLEHFNEDDWDDAIEYPLSDDARERLEEVYKSRRREDARIMRMASESEQEKRLIEIYSRELAEFFERFPQFRIILEED